MEIYINEQKEIVEENTLFKIKDKFKSDADIIILNGFPIKEDKNIKNGDKITLIKRGEIPKKEELEALMISRHTPYVYEMLKKGRVAIAGAGGLGSNVALSLARIGVGFIKIIDFDVVEPSNLNRQQYYVKHIGMKKVHALKGILKEVNPFVNIEAVDKKIEKENIQDLFKDVDIIVEAFDNPEYKAMLVSEILTKFKDKKIVSASGMAGFYSNNIIQTKKINKRFYICGDFVNEAKINDGLMAPRVAIVANHQANTVVRLLLGEEEI
ncbi:MAG: sulfur carrier protein ThiS adenylyltransferase ThiF [Clostridium sp.]|nr:sulfur carrier protein ThiS adenylyltransferase ThiF [Clostridium sp.]